MPRRVVLFGGTFDPVQLGHTAIAEQTVRELTPDEFRFVVANIPGERRPVHAPAEVRLEMVRAAVGGDARFVVDDSEIRRGGETYTHDTMRELHRLHPDTVFLLLLGVDSARSIRAWRHGDALLRSERFVVVERAGEEEFTLDEARCIGYDVSHLQLLHVSSPPVSASDVRRRAARGESLDGLVAPAVAAIIRRDGLYAPGPARA